MNVKDAVKKAIEYVADIFEAEKLENIGLEEVVLNEDEHMWEVTIGFSRPWDHQKIGILAGVQALNPTRRYKIIKIDNETEEVKSIKIRETPNA
jgi:inactivated superfamily I helicase